MLRPPPPTAIPEPARPELPRHIGIIMDGNGRWAKRRHLPRAAGHRAGVRAIRQVMEACNDAGVHILTLYAFSTENWRRPEREVNALMRLFQETMDSEIDELDAKGIQLRIIGDRSKLSRQLRAKVDECERRTVHNRDNVLNVAINYGGRSEVVEAIRELASSGVDLRDLDEATLSGALYTAGLPDPDLIIRTAGELRVSNFLLWQGAYAELHVTDTLWPDFGPADVSVALGDFRSRRRTFGQVVDSPGAGAGVAAAAGSGAR
jgi:undecaprenyl diphosphate synthase